MTAPPDDTTTDVQAVISALQAERDAALREKAVLAEALAKRNGEYAKRIEHQGLAADIEALKVEVQEIHAAQVAGLKVLQAMVTSPGDTQPVFDLIARLAAELCTVPAAAVAIFDGTMLHLATQNGLDPTLASLYATQFPRPVGTDTVMGRAILSRRVEQIEDVAADPAYGIVGLSGYWSTMAVPLLRDGSPLGVIGVGRPAIVRFPDNQVTLLQTFAEQAVIAINSTETYRALQTRTSDLQETLEYQTAISDVLKVISRSTFDLQPVLDTLVETAARLCDAEQSVIYRREGELVWLVANYGFPPEYEAVTKALGKFPLDRNSPTVGGRASIERRPVHIHDVSAVPGYWEVALRLGKQRTSLGVPLLREGEAIGHIVLARQRVEPFTERQIELVSTFADQAVIAIENTRLLTEQREALEQQTATAEVLQVINASPGNLTPVFDAMLEKALRLCGAAFGGLSTFDGERRTIVARTPAYEASVTAEEGTSVIPPMMSRLIETKRPVQIADRRDVEGFRDGASVRTLLHVPLLKDETVLGCITVYRQEVRPYSDKEVALLENFAAQAVIAMENARLITEQREALEQQTATAEVLQVINSSPGNLAPVFDAMLEKAMRLCGAAFGNLWTYDGEVGRLAAICGASPEYRAELMRAGPQEPEPGSSLIRLVEGEPLIHIADITAEGAHRSGAAVRRMLADRAAARTVLWVPMHKEGALLGFFTIYRTEVRPFTDKQIALLENFAAQAVVAMENARLLTEQQEALEQQTATAEVLQVINGSPGNLTPVFNSMPEKAMRLCGAAFGSLYTYDGEQFHSAAQRGVPAAYSELRERTPPSGRSGGPGTRILQTKRTVHILDMMSDDTYQSGHAGIRALVELGGARTILGVPLLKDDVVVGYISIYRQEVRAFSGKEIALLENFAVQAVIAMENARLISEQREALEQQTATSDVLQVINSSLGDLAPVFDAILEKAHRLCGVTHGGLVLRDGETFRAVATHTYSGAFEEQLRQGYHGADNPITRSLLAGARVVHLPDLSRIDHPMVRASFELEGVRTGLFVPLLKDDTLLGMISSTRTEMRPFSDKEIALVENFAAQAVIAMENARLLGELRQRTGDLQESLEYQTAISDVLKVISRSTFDLQPVLETLLGTAARLCDADGGGISLREGNGYRMAASYYSATSDYDAFFRNRLMTVDRGSVTGRTVLEARIIHVTDIMSDPEFTFPAVLFGGARTVLGVPLLRDGAVVGVLILLRKPVLPFTDRQIELVTTFADQAVIAIENVRLVTEQQDALEQQTATAEVLGVINASPGNLAPVFDAMLEKATRLCEADFGILWDFDGDLAQAGALHRVPTAYAEMVRPPFRPSPESGPARMMRGEGTVVVADLLEFPPYHAGDALVRAIVDLAGARSVVITPLRKDAVTLGAITIYRQEVRPFTEKQIALLENFAAQAVIAMENARLIDEIRTARDDAEATLRELKTAQANLIQAEKMASLGQLTAGIAHEIKNPLNFINNFSDLSVELLGELTATAAPGFALLDADRRAELDEVVGTLTSNLEKITEHGRRADGIVRGMLEHSRGSSGERRMIDLNALIDEALNLAYHGARAQDQSFDITLERDFGEGITPIEVNPQDLTRVFLNLFSNGFYATIKRARDGRDAEFVPMLKAGMATRRRGAAAFGQQAYIDLALPLSRLRHGNAPGEASGHIKRRSRGRGRSTSAPWIADWKPSAPTNRLATSAILRVGQNEPMITMPTDWSTDCRPNVDQWHTDHPLD